MRYSFELGIVSRENNFFPLFRVTRDVKRKTARKLKKQWAKVPWGTAEFVPQVTYLDRGSWWVDTGG